MQLEQPIASYNGTPQIEDGFTRIANELLEAIILFKFSERQYKILFALIRKTYGFNKTNDEISLSQLSTVCNLPVNHVSTVISQLVSINVVIKSQGKYANNLKINKLYDTWGLHNMECHKVECQVVELQVKDNGVTSLGVLPFPTMEVQNTTPKDNTKEISIDCLNHLNKTSNRNYKPIKTNLDLISARLKEGFTKEDVMRVIDLKVSQWVNTDYEKYLRPETLFNAKKFSGYEQEKPKAFAGRTTFENFAVNKLLGKS